MTGEGVQVVDPRHLAVNKLPPPVHIEQIAADHKTYWQHLPGADVSNLHLPALTRDLQIDYTALSLVAPERNRFRYKLEGQDRDWIDAGNRRQAFYTDLNAAPLPFPRHRLATIAACGTRPANRSIFLLIPRTTRPPGSVCPALAYV